jgi:conjugal transfer pilus assembly protein TraV
MWVAPWEDEDGDLHDQSYLYTVVEKGRWVVEANQAAIRKGFAPVFAVSKPPQGNDGQQRPAGGPPGQNIGAGVPGRVPARAGGEASGVGMPFGPLQAPGQD